jgi:hypothetical protein
MTRSNLFHGEGRPFVYGEALDPRITSIVLATPSCDIAERNTSG